LVNEESWVTQDSINTEHRVRQNSVSKNLEVRKDVTPSRWLAPQWCLRGITKTQKRRQQKMCQRELAEKKEEEERDYWFHHLRPMTRLEKTWTGKWLGKEEGGSSGAEASKVTPARGEDNPGSGDRNPKSGNCHPELGNCHPESGNHNPDLGNSDLGKENDRQGEEPASMDVNMVFMISAEFPTPTEHVTVLALGAEHAVFVKPKNPSTHVKPLFIQGKMLIDGGASINILSLLLFQKLFHVEGDLKCTNLSLSGFAGDPTEAKGIICKELMVGRKTVPTAFFVVDVK
jgi:hypothetical protein